MEENINEENRTPVLIDMPVVVDKESEVVGRQVEVQRSVSRLGKIPWAIIGVGMVVILIVMALSFWSLRVADRPDIELTAPAGQRTLQPKVTSELPVATSVGGSLLSDTPYVSTDENFQIKSPSGWSLDTSGKTGSEVVFLSPTTVEVGSVQYATLINVIVENVERIILEDQVVESKKSLLEAYPDFTFEEDLLLYITGRPFQLLSGTYTVDGVPLRIRSLITIYKDKAYAISATGPVETWDENDLAITASLYSFRPL